jgi:transposase-like protein
MMTTESKRSQSGEPELEEVAAAVPGAEVAAVMPTALVGEDAWREYFAAQMLERARAEGLRLVGRDGLLAGITKAVLETALQTELSDHLGYEPGEAPPSGESANKRNGHTRKTVHTGIGPVDLHVPRDRAGTFEPVTVPKHVRRVDGFDESILSLYAKGLTTGEIQAHLHDVYGAEVSRELISKITDAVNEELVAWRNRPLDRVYAVMFIDAIVVKIRDGAVANRPVYVAVGVSLDGQRDVLGLWVGTGGEGAKQWLAYLTELRNRGVADVLILCSDGLKGIGEAIESVWPQTTHQTCVVHLCRNTLRYTSRRDWQRIMPAIRSIYTASTVDEAESRLEELEETWGNQYPAVIRLWRDSWERFTPFLSYHVEVRKVLYTTNMVESMNARFRQATRRRGHFPNEQAALKVLYLVIREKNNKGKDLIARVNGWKSALNALALSYGDRININ